MDSGASAGAFHAIGGIGLGQFDRFVCQSIRQARAIVVEPLPFLVSDQLLQRDQLPVTGCRAQRVRCGRMEGVCFVFRGT